MFNNIALLNELQHGTGIYLHDSVPPGMAPQRVGSLLESGEEFTFNSEASVAT